MDYYYTSAAGETYKITVSFDAGSGIPENAQVDVKEISQEDPSYTDYIEQTANVLGLETRFLSFARPFDIKLVNPETGEHYQPSKNVKVSIKLLDQDVEKDGAIKIVHFAEDQDGNETFAHEVDCRVSGEAVEFETNGFSVYVVAGEELMQHFVFLNDMDGGLTASNVRNYIFSEQVLIDGETLVVPPMPTKDGTVFNYWVTWDATNGIGTDPVDFANLSAISIDANSIEGSTKEEKQNWLDEHPTYYYAVYGNPKTVIVFYNQSGLIIDKIEVEKPSGDGASVSFNTRDVNYIPIQDKVNVALLFKYWTDDAHGAGNETGTNGVISITSASPNVIGLYPKLDEGHYIYFDSNTDSYSDLSFVEYTGPLTVLDGQNATEVCASLNTRDNHAIPTVNGYIFRGWYVRSTDAHDNDEDLNTKTNPVFYPNEAGTEMLVETTEYAKLLDSAGKLPNNPTLYAHWTKEATADYTVIVWQQKLNSTDGKSVMTGEDAYAFAESVVIPNHSTDSANPAIISEEFKNLNDDTAYNSVHNLTGDNRKTGKDNPYYGFVLNTDISELSKTVAPDGSTVLNVYYDRAIHTLTFKDNMTGYYYNPTTAESGTLYGLVDNEYVQLTRKSRVTGYYLYRYSGTPYTGTIYDEDGNVVTNPVYPNDYYRDARGWYDLYWGTNTEIYWTYGNNIEYSGTRYTRGYGTYLGTVAEITAPYGVNIEDYFPIKNSNNQEYNNSDQKARWEPQNSTEYSNVIAKILSMPGVDITFKYSDGGDRPLKTLNYLAEVLDGETGTATFNGKSYKGFYSFSARYNYLTKNEDVYPFEGRKFVGSDPEFAEEGDLGLVALHDGQNSSINIFYDRVPYTIYFRDSRGISDPFSPVQIKYGEVVPDFNNATNNHLPTDSSQLFSGWYMDETCKTRVYFTQASYDAATGNKELLSNMPAHSIQLYAGWAQTEYEIHIIPNGAELGTQGSRFWLNDGEKISLANPTRDYIPVETDTGIYDYDSQRGHYTEAEDSKGDYEAKTGAYVFQGWYEAEVLDPTPVTEEYESGKFSTGYADATPKTNANGEYVVSDTQYNQGVPPTGPVVLVALWQRVGDFRVVYNTVDPAINNEPVAEPEDLEEYIDGAHAIVKGAISAPEGYALEYWEDKNHNHLKPNELVSVNENNATIVGEEMQVILTAHYREFHPNERNMADYTFMTNINEAGTGFDSNYEKWEVQRIAVNEELKAPKTPTAPQGYAFRGWYYDTLGIRPFNGFGVIANPVYTTIYAVFDRVFHVNYHLTEMIDGVMTKTEIVLATQTYKNPGDNLSDEEYEELDTRHVDHVVDLDHYVGMWVSDWNDKDNPDKQFEYLTLTNKRVKSDMDLYAVLKARTFVTFNSCGGSYVDQQEIYEDSWPVRPKEPTRDGFEFLGWYTQQEGGTLYEFNMPIDDVEGVTTSDSYTLYAHWRSTGTEAGTLHVIFWAQNADRSEDDTEAENDYSHYQMIYNATIENVPYGTYTRDNLKSPYLSDFVNGDYDIVTTVQKGWNESVNETRAFVTDALGYKGNNADAAGTDDNGNPNWKAENYISDLQYYYTLSSKSDASVEVSGDEESVINIRFDLIQYYLQFKHNNKAEIHYNGNTYPASGTSYYEIPIWLNRPISEQWPIDKTTNPDRTSAYVNWNDSSQLFDCWKMTVDIIKKDTPSTLEKTTDKEYRTAVTLADKLLIDSVRKYGTNVGTKRVLYVTPASKSNTNFRAVVHYMIRDPYYDRFTERTDLQMIISVPKRPDWAKTNISTTSGLYWYNDDDDRVESKTNDPPYYGFQKNKCIAHQTGTEDYFHTDTSLKYLKYAYSELEPIGLSGYIGLDNEYAHLGDLLNENGEQDDGAVNDLNVSLLYNLISARKGLAHVIFDTHDPTYKAYFKNHTDQYVTAENTYNFYFYYKPLSYTLSFFTDSSTKFGSDQTVFCGETLDDKMPTVTPTPAPGQSVAFAGWALAPFKTSEEDQYNGHGYTMPSHNLALYAIWKPVTYSVKTLGVDVNGNGFLANAEGNEIDADGNLVENGKTSAVYTLTSAGGKILYGTMIKELNIAKPKMSGKIFEGWADNASEAAVTSSHKIIKNMVIKPLWGRLESRSVKYYANFPADLDTNSTKYASFEGDVPTAPEDTKQYVLGSRVTLKDSNGLYIRRKDVNGNIYTATFAFWEDAEGNRYYPSTVYVFRDNSPEELKLYAVYSEYRETILTYDKNGSTDGTKFILNNEKATSDQPDDYSGKKQDGVTDRISSDGTVKVLFRDEMNKDFEKSFQKKPNDPFPIGEDEDSVKFTVTRTEGGNTYYFAGWGTDANSSVPVAQNGDLAYVNTIEDENGVLRNTLYAIWAICQVKDKNGTYHYFDTLGEAVTFVNGSSLITGKTGTIEMLIDYTMPSSDAVTIPENCNITLTTAQTGGSSSNPAVITRGYVGGSMFTVENGGSLTLADSNGGIVLDGNKATYTANTAGGLVSVGSSASLTIQENATLQNSKSSANGGAVSLGSGSTLTMTGGSITGNEATTGAAVSVGAGATLNMSGGSISGNTATDTNGGAVNVADDTSRLKFSGKPTIHGNGTTDNPKNIVLSADSNSVIQTTGSGLTGGSLGVYVVDAQQEEHGVSTKAFGTAGSGAYSNLNVFKNDRNPQLYGEKADNGTIVWSGALEYICKIVDDSGEHPFKLLNKAVDYARKNLSGTATIQMLVDYMVPASDKVVLNQATDNITITTAATSGGQYNFIPTFTESDGRLSTDSRDRAILKRDSEFTDDTLFTVGGTAKLSTTDIIFDGGATAEKNADDTYNVPGTLTAYKANFVSAYGGGSVTVQGGTTMRNSSTMLDTGNSYGSREGGAIFADDSSTVKITNGTGKSVEFLNCKSTTGGAVLSENSITIENAGTLSFKNCVSRRGGALDLTKKGGTETITNSGTIIFEKCQVPTVKSGSTEYAGYYGGAICANNGTIEINNGGQGSIQFKECMAGGRGGALDSKLLKITGEGNTRFENCTALAGGAIYQEGTDEMVLTNCTFDECHISIDYRTENSASGSSGGAIYSNGNLKVMGINLFKNCYISSQVYANNSSGRASGAAIFFNGDKTFQVEKGTTTFRNCRIDGNQPNNMLNERYGAAIASGKNLTLTNKGTLSFDSCYVSLNSSAVTGTITQKACGGAVSAGRKFNVNTYTLTINNSGSLSFDNCYANVDYSGGVTSATCQACGGALYASSTMTISNTGEGTVTFEDCKATGTNAETYGGAIYQNGGALTKVVIDGHEDLDATVTNAKKGGAIYSCGNVTFDDISVTDCSASNGSAIYIDNATMNMNNGSITGNTVSETCGAVEVGGTSSQLIFKGTPVVYDNKNGNQQKNVVLDQKLNTIIQVPADGLSDSANIGVYVVGDDTENESGDSATVFDLHGESLDPFGTYPESVTEKTAIGNLQLFHFINDRNGLLGAARKTDNKIVWMKVVPLTVTKVLVDAHATGTEEFKFTPKLMGTKNETPYEYLWSEKVLGNGNPPTSSIETMEFKEQEDRTIFTLKKDDSTTADAREDQSVIKLPVGSELKLAESMDNSSALEQYTTTVDTESLTGIKTTPAPAIEDGHTAVFTIAEDATAPAISIKNSREDFSITIYNDLQDYTTNVGTIMHYTATLKKGDTPMANCRVGYIMVDHVVTAEEAAADSSLTEGETIEQQVDIYTDDNGNVVTPGTSGTVNGFDLGAKEELVLEVPKGVDLMVTQEVDSRFTTTVQSKENTANTLTSNTSFKATFETSDTITFTNKLNGKELYIKVVDDANNVLAGAKFDITSTDVSLTDLTSQDDGFIRSIDPNSPTLFTLPSRIYTIKQTSTLRNYEKVTGDITLTVNDAYEASINNVEGVTLSGDTLTIENKRKAAKVTVVMEANGDHLTKNYEFTSSGLGANSFTLRGSDNADTAATVENKREFANIPLESSITVALSNPEANSDSLENVIFIENASGKSTLSGTTTNAITIEGDTTITFAQIDPGTTVSIPLTKTLELKDENGNAKTYVTDRSSLSDAQKAAAEKEDEQLKKLNFVFEIKTDKTWDEDSNDTTNPADGLVIMPSGTTSGSGNQYTLSVKDLWDQKTVDGNKLSWTVNPAWTVSFKKPGQYKLVVTEVSPGDKGSYKSDSTSFDRTFNVVEEEAIGTQQGEFRISETYKERNYAANASQASPAQAPISLGDLFYTDTVKDSSHCVDAGVTQNGATIQLAMHRDTWSAITTQFSFDFSRSFTISGHMDIPSEDGYAFAFQTVKKVDAQNRESGYSLDYAKMNEDAFIYGPSVSKSDISKGFLFVIQNEPQAGYGSYRMSGLTRTPYAADSGCMNNGHYELHSKRTLQASGSYEIKYEKNSDNDKGKLTITVPAPSNSSRTFTYTNFDPKTIFGDSNWEKMYFSIGATVDHITSLEYADLAAGLSLTYSQYQDGVGSANTSFWADRNGDGTFDTQVNTSDSFAVPGEEILVRHVIIPNNIRNEVIYEDTLITQLKAGSTPIVGRQPVSYGEGNASTTYSVNNFSEEAFNSYDLEKAMRVAILPGVNTYFEYRINAPSTYNTTVIESARFGQPPLEDLKTDTYGFRTESEPADPSVSYNNSTSYITLTYDYGYKENTNDTQNKTEVIPVLKNGIQDVKKLTRPQYVLKGWNVLEDDTASKVVNDSEFVSLKHSATNDPVVAPGDRIRVESNTTLTAVWKDAYAMVVTYDVVDNDGTVHSFLTRAEAESFIDTYNNGKEESEQLSKTEDIAKTENLFDTLKDTMDFIRNDLENGAMDTTTPATIQMLRDYEMTGEDAQAMVIEDGENITLTTASKASTEHPNGYIAPQDDSDKTTATITRKTSGSDMVPNTSSMFTQEGGTLTFSGPVTDGGSNTGIILNGGNNTDVTANGAIVSVTGGNLKIADGSSLEDGKTSGNGGAVYVGTKTTGEGTSAVTTVGSVTMAGGTLKNNTAANGGAVYVEDGTGKDGNGTEGQNPTFLMQDGTITGNSATSNGSAIYVDGPATTGGDSGGKVVMTGGSITGNTVDSDTGAVEVGGTDALLSFSGDARVYDNTYTTTEQQVTTTHQSNILLDVDPTQVLQAGTTSTGADGNPVNTGLGENARIGVNLTGELSDTTSPYKDHGQSGQDFATAITPTSGTNNVAAFTNDRNANLYGESSTDGTTVHWTSYVCKIVDADGTEHPFKSLKEALIYARENKNGTATIEMLRDYTMPAGDTLDIGVHTVNGAEVTDNITITTAKKDGNSIYKYEGTGNTATITRGTDIPEGTSMITQTGGTLNFSDPSTTYTDGTNTKPTGIILDGGEIQTSANGSIVNVTGGTLNIKDGAVLQNADTTGGDGITTGLGGAVYVGKNAADPTNETVGTVNLETGAVIGDENVSDTNDTGNKAKKGGAIYVDNGSVGTNPAVHPSLNINGGTISGNTADTGGSAVYVDADGTDGGSFHMSGGSITNNKGSYTDEDTVVGAVQVGGANATLTFTGTPVVDDNTGSDTTKELNVVLDQDTKDVIHAGDGDDQVEKGAHIGVYVTGDPADTDSIYNKHGEYQTNLGSSTENPGAMEAFKNDVDPLLYGKHVTVTASDGSEEEVIQWTKNVAMLTDNDDNILYKQVGTDGNGNPIYEEALYDDIQAAFEGAEAGSTQPLFKSDGNGGYVAYGTDQPVKVQLLSDVEMADGDEINFESDRPITLTTAPTSTDPADMHAYHPKDGANGYELTKATITKKDGSTGTAPMFTFSTGNTVTVADVIVDGNSDGNGTDTSTKATTGGAFRIVDKDPTNPTTASFTDVTIENVKNANTDDPDDPNDTDFNGGAIYVETTGTPSGSTPSLSLTGVEITNCEAVNGGGVYIADDTTPNDENKVTVTVNPSMVTTDTTKVDKPTTISDCQATGAGPTDGKGAAIYVGDNVTTTLGGANDNGNQTSDPAVAPTPGVVITGNKTPNNETTGGAVNVGSTTVKDDNENITSVTSHGTVELTGNVKITDNGPTTVDSTTGQTVVTQQKNIVLDVPSTGVVETVGTGLGDNAQVGVYVTDTPVANPDGTTSTVYKEHGIYNTSFSTLSSSESNASKLSNDRNDKLTGEKNSTSGTTGEWTDLTCKLTDGDGNLLFTGPSFSEPAVYESLEDAFAGADPASTTPLYKAVKKDDGTWEFVLLDSDTNKAPIQIQMLQDTSLKEPITYDDARDITITTAPSKTNASNETKTSMDALGDVYFYTPGTDSDPNKAKITNDQPEQDDQGNPKDIKSMITVNAPGKTVKIDGLILDGNDKTTTGNGGAINITNGNVKVEDSVLQNFTVSGDGSTQGTGAGGLGGAIYVGEPTSTSTPTLTLTNTALTGNSAINGGAVYVAPGTADSGSTAGKHPTVTLENATLVGNTATNVDADGNTVTGGGNGGGIYVSAKAKVEMENYTEGTGDDAHTVTQNSTIAGNSSVGDGAGVYLAEGATAEVSGNPDFGGTDVYKVYPSEDSTEGTDHLIQTKKDSTGAIAQFYIAVDENGNETEQYVTIVGNKLVKSDTAVYYKTKIDSEGRISRYTTTTDSDGNSVDTPLDQTDGKEILFEKSSTDGKYYRVTFDEDGTKTFVDGEDTSAAVRPILANYSGSLEGTDHTYPTNGGQDYPQERQDIFVAGFANTTDSDNNVIQTPATSVVITGPLGYPTTSGGTTTLTPMDPGSIWVMAENKEHYEMLTQVAVVDPDLLTTVDGKTTLKSEIPVAGGNVSSDDFLESLQALRNGHVDEGDNGSGCGGEFLRGQLNPDNPGQITWTGGFDVEFNVYDGFGNGLADADFKLYDPKKNSVTNLTQAYQKNEADVKATSADGYLHDAEGNVVLEEDGLTPRVDPSATTPSGSTKFDKVPTGMWYLKESNAGTSEDPYPTSTVEGEELSWKDDNTYVILVGDKAMTRPASPVAGSEWAEGGLLSYLTQADIDKQREYIDENGVTQKKDFVIFRIVTVQDEDGNSVQVAAPVVDRNETDALDEKVASGTALTEAEQARRDLFGKAPDVSTYGLMSTSVKEEKVILSKVNESLEPLSGATFTIRRMDRTVIAENIDSNQLGAFFIGKLPYGTYLVEETTAPTGTDVTTGNTVNYNKPTHYLVFSVTPNGVKNITNDPATVIGESTVGDSTTGYTNYQVTTNAAPSSGD